MTLIRLQPELLGVQPDTRKTLADGETLLLGDHCRLVFRALPLPRIQVVGRGVKGLPVRSIHTLNLLPLAPWLVSIVAVEYDNNGRAQAAHLALTYQTAKLLQQEEVSREKEK